MMSSDWSFAAAIEEYKNKGLAGRVGFGKKPAILVIDFTLGFTDPSSPLGSNLDQAIEATNKLLEAARRKGIPVFFTAVAYEEDLGDSGLWIKKIPSLAVLRSGSRFVDIDPRLERRPGEQLILKKYASAFFGTHLASTLTSCGVDTVIIAGCTTSGCVRASVVDAIQYGFRPIVVREAVGDRSKAAHEANLFDIEGKYGDVISLEEALRYLSSVAEPR